MCDALSRNLLSEFDTIRANCVSHARREFVTVAPSFPAECRYVLEAFRDVCRFDAEAIRRATETGEAGRDNPPTTTALIS